MISLITDFSSKEHYAGVIKGMLISANVNFVELTNEIEPFDVLHASYVLSNTYFYFPDNTVHLVIIDPGQSTIVPGIVAKLDKGYFVGPNNGILTLLRENVKEAYEIIPFQGMRPVDRWKYLYTIPSIKLALNQWPENLKKINLSEIKLLNIPNPVLSMERIVASIIHIDRFGNIVLNIKGDIIKFSYGEEMFLNYNGIHKLTFRTSYSEGSKEEFMLLVNSENYLEIAINGGNAAMKLNAKKLDIVSLEFK